MHHLFELILSAPQPVEQPVKQNKNKRNPTENYILLKKSFPLWKKR